MNEEHPTTKGDYLSGKMIEPLELKGNESVADFLENVFGGSGFNGRRLYEACQIYERMITEDVTICLTLAGAMTPIGMSGPIITLVEKGFVDFIVATGANLYHDLHRAYDFPMVQGSPAADDDDLNEKGIARIYDVFLQDDDTLIATDKAILNSIHGETFRGCLSTADLHYRLGQEVQKNAPHPEKSLLAACARYGVPIYTSSPGDSSIAMNLVIPHYFSEPIPLDPLRDIVETTAIVYKAEKNGAVEVGGGSPKNFYMQTQPMLWQIFDIPTKGHDYFIQLTADAPHWGGLSGATPQEAKSWGKVRHARLNNVVVYSCASITFPLLCQFVCMRCEPRESKRLLEGKDGWAEEILEFARNSEKLRRQYKKYSYF
jgi:deoxyhypusine synthase